jgi:hypothetical protein
MLQNLIQHGRFDSRMNACDGDVSTIRVNGKCVSTGRIWYHSVIEPEKTTATGQKMARILKEVKSNLVCVEHPTQKIFTTPDCSENLRTREGRMKKKSNLGHWNSSGEIRRQDKQMKSMNPD